MKKFEQAEKDMGLFNPCAERRNLHINAQNIREVQIMINPFEVIETIKMVDEENLDIRTITMGISLKSCAGPDVDTVCEKVYEKITTYAKDLVKTGEDIEAQFGIPIINKRISVTPIATLVDALEEPTVEKCVKIAKTLDKAAKKTGVNFIGGYTALVHKDYTNGERILIESIPEALAATDLVCSSVNVGSTRAGINMDAVKQMGQIVKRAAELTADTQGFACAKLVVFCNAVEDNPFMAGAFLGEGEGECVINVGVSGPGVVKCALEKVKGEDFGVVAETIKKRLHLRLQEWVSLWQRKRHSGLTFLSESWICHWLRHRQSATALRIY